MQLFWDEGSISQWKNKQWDVTPRPNQNKVRKITPQKNISERQLNSYYTPSSKS
jgi:hypothetical protein